MLKVNKSTVLGTGTLKIVKSCLLKIRDLHCLLVFKTTSNLDALYAILLHFSNNHQPARSSLVYIVGRRKTTSNPDTEQTHKNAINVTLFTTKVLSSICSVY